MKAMVLEQVGTPLRLTEVAAPVPREGQVLVRVLASGICGSQIGEINERLAEFSAAEFAQDRLRQRQEATETRIDNGRKNEPRTVSTDQC